MATQTQDGELKAVKEDLATLRNDVQALIKAMADERKAQGKEAIDKARSEVNRLTKEASDMGRDGIHTVERHIEERPFTSVLTAFGIGLVIGKLLDR